MSAWEKSRASGKKSCQQKKVAPAKKKSRQQKYSRASEKKSRQQKKVAPAKKSRASKKKSRQQKRSLAAGKKVCAKMWRTHVWCCTHTCMMLYAHMYGTYKAPYKNQSSFWVCKEALECFRGLLHLRNSLTPKIGR